jgi:hypothetical protein
MKLPLLLVCLLWANAAMGQRITVMVAPFDSAQAGDPEIGKKVGVILNLQIWQTLRIPKTKDGSRTKGLVTWDVTSKPPTSFAEAEELGRAQSEDVPQFVLWGRAWRYGTGNVVEAFLSIRNDVEPSRSADFWKVSLPNGSAIGVGLPRRHIDFKPIVLRADLLAELRDPGGLKLYAEPTGNAVLGVVGDEFTALEQGPDTAEIVLPDHTKGWVRQGLGSPAQPVPRR